MKLREISHTLSLVHCLLDDYCEDRRRQLTTGQRGQLGTAKLDMQHALRCIDRVIEASGFVKKEAEETGIATWR